MDGVADVIAEVHELGLQAAAARRSPPSHPVEDLTVIVIAAVLARAPALRPAGPLPPGPGVLGDGIETGPREVDAHRTTGGVQGLGLQAGQDAQGLGVALEAADGLGDDIERLLAVVPVGRVAQVVGQAGGVDDVGIAAQGLPEGATDLGDLQGVGQAGAHEVVAGGPQDLGLGAQAPQRRGVDDARPVALEGGALGILRGLGHETGDAVRPVADGMPPLPADGPVIVAGAGAVRRRPAGRLVSGSVDGSVDGHGHKVSQQGVTMRYKLVRLSCSSVRPRATEHADRSAGPDPAEGSWMP